MVAIWVRTDDVVDKVWISVMLPNVCGKFWASVLIASINCKIACNIDPLKGHFRVQFRPL